LSTAPHIVVVTWFHDGQVGYRDFLYRLHALAAHYRVTIISRRALPEPELAIAGVPVVVLRSAHRGVRELARYWWAVARWLKKNPASVVLHLGSHSAAVAGWSVGMPQAVYWNEHLTHYLSTPAKRGVKPLAMWVLRQLQYRGARRAALVMPIGSGQRADLLQHGCDPARVQLLAMGVAPDFAPSAPAERGGSLGAAASVAGPLRVVYAGAIHPDRGRDVFIEALALARAKGADVHLTMIGAEHSQQQICLERARTLGVDSALRVLPRLPGMQIPPLLQAADFGLCAWIDTPHYRVNPPTKLFEYFVAGLPVMASRIASHTEHVQDGANGLLFDYAAYSLAATFERALQLRAQWPAMRELALASGQPHRWEHIEPRFLSAMEGLVT
jgi:glycosyltransferase involved in cell wall biosynthesis